MDVRLWRLGRVGSALAIASWIYGSVRDAKTVPQVLSWTLLAWAALSLPNGAPAFVTVIAAFLLLRFLIPSMKQLWRIPAKAKTDFLSANAVPPVTALLVGLCLLGGAINLGAANALPESVTQQINIVDNTATATATIQWQAQKGDVLPLLFQPAVLTGVNYPRTLSLQPAPQGLPYAQRLLAESSGDFTIEVHYQLQIAKNDSGADNGLALPVPSGLINRATLTLTNLNVDVFSPQAVSVQRSMSGSTYCGDARPGARRCTSRLATAQPRREGRKIGLLRGFCAALHTARQASSRVFIRFPSARRKASWKNWFSTCQLARPSPTYLRTLELNSSQTTDQSSIVSLWRFDPDTRKLRVTLNPPMSGPFSLSILSQVATETLPFQQSVGLISVEGAEQQSGSLGVATGNDVQLDDAAIENCPPINLDDFPANVMQPFSAQFPGLTVRRAFHYSDTQARAMLKVSAVEPDVRVVTRDTLSLGEDRTVLASTADVTIKRGNL